MKQFIVFLAIVILEINSMVYHTDLGAAKRLGDSLDYQAREYARGAAMFFDREAYKEGWLRFDADEVKAYTDYMLGLYMDSRSGGYIDELSCCVSLYHEDGTVSRIENGVVTEIEKKDHRDAPDEEISTGDCPRVIVELTAKTHVYRQPFVGSDTISRRAVFEEAGY